MALLILSLDLPETAIDKIHATFDTLMSDFFQRTITLDSGVMLYRARLAEERPSFVRDVGIPPKDKVGYGRVNTPGHPVLYLAENRDVALSEIGAEPGQQVALSTWRVREKILVGNAGFTGRALRGLNPDAGIPEWKTKPSPYGEPDLDDQHRRYCEAVEDFLGQIFLLNVPPDQTFLYKLSIAVAKVLGFNPAGDRHVERVAQFHHKITGASMAEGIYYPSVAHQANGGNVAIRSQSVKKLELQDVEWLQIVYGSNNTARPTGVDFANSVSDGGRLEWKGRSVRYQLTSPGQIARWVYTGDDTFEIHSDQPLRRV